MSDGLQLSLRPSGENVTHQAVQAAVTASTWSLRGIGGAPELPNGDRELV